MLVSFMYVLLAILGLSFLVFIHELGHYFMARRVGMRVETFSIGFGKPIYYWEKDGVKWQIGWLPFGGFVKIAGVDFEKGKNPYEIPDGFFGKKPIDRIKVALMGPLANLAFALLAFTFLWSIGGREKNFSEYSSKIGWVDPNSELYALGVRPGDVITAYNDNPFQSVKDHINAPMTADGQLNVKGYKVNYATGIETPFDYNVKVYQHPTSLEKGIMTAGILQSGSYLIYNRLPNGQDNPLPEGSPMLGSGVEYGDRIVWIDGQLVFSMHQMQNILSGSRALLTIERDGKAMLVRVPRVKVQELRLDQSFREELVDWQFEAGLNESKLQNLFAIPYNLTNDGIVEEQLKLIDRDKEFEAFPEHPASSLESPLLPGDKIIAIYGLPIKHSAELLRQLQTYRVNVIVERNPLGIKKIPAQLADHNFDLQVQWNDITAIADHIGTAHPITHEKDMYLLAPIIPKTRSDFLLTPDKQAQWAKEMRDQQKAIESIEDPERKSYALRLLQQQEQQLVLGLPNLQDKKVEYNPSPLTLFKNVFQEIWHLLEALFSGLISPKWIVGPIGIVQVVHDTAMGSLKEAVFWLGAISLNLGVLNLLPIPVLDGGSILLSLFEMVTRKRLQPKTMEGLIIPFAILLVGLFVFLTYHDLMRLFK